MEETQQDDTHGRDRWEGKCLNGRIIYTQIDQIKRSRHRRMGAQRLTELN